MGNGSCQASAVWYAVIVGLVDMDSFGECFKCFSAILLQLHLFFKEFLFLLLSTEYEVEAEFASFQL
jgi:hypothetical protein